MSSNKRVFITGMGALSASGNSLDENWQSILTGKSFLGQIEENVLSNWEYQLGGEIKGVQPAKMLPDRKLLKVISKHDVFGINAAMQAVEHSQLLTYRDSLEDKAEFNDRSAVFVGSPGNKYFQQYDFLPLLAKTTNMQDFAAQLFNEVHPMWLLRILPNNVLAYAGITYEFKGVNHNITNHAVGGMQAIIEAYHAIQSGQADRALVIAYDLGAEPQALYYYSKLGVVSKQHLKPFDAQHDGTILAEGAAALILESEESVTQRHAKCYAEICAGASGTEQAGLFSLENEGESLAVMLTELMDRNNIPPNEVGMVVSHGNGNKASDISEAAALASVFKEEQPPVTAFKWSMGHTITASGVIDTLLAVCAAQENTIPGIANLVEKAQACNALNLSSNNRSRNESKPFSVIINRGFASMNAALVIKTCD
jgi:3-oxoacyl-[acyl-carrier-protein] synthase-1